MQTVVVALEGESLLSIQVILVPFRTWLTEGTTIMDTSGKSLSPETLENINVAEFIITTS